MKKTKDKKKLLIFLILIVTLACLKQTNYGFSKEITKDLLCEQMQKFNLSKFSTENNIKLEMSEGNIQLKNEEEQGFIIECNTDNINPTFTTNISISSDMSYSDFTDQMELLTMPFPYVLIAGIEGIEEEDSSMYFLYKCFMSPNKIKIKETEYTDAINAINQECSIPIEINDELELNSFTIKITKSNVNDNLCTVTSVLEIKNSANLKRLNNFSTTLQLDKAEQVEPPENQEQENNEPQISPETNIYKNNRDNINNSNSNIDTNTKSATNTNENKNQTLPKNEIVYSGKNDYYFFAGSILIIIIAFTLIYLKKYENI